jgi:DNA-binding MarR family transcriptional regulator
VTARSFAAIEDRVTLPQLRVMVMIASRGPLNLGSIAESFDVHPSSISRAYERLVTAGLLDRTTTGGPAQPLAHPHRRQSLHR